MTCVLHSIRVHAIHLVMMVMAIVLLGIATGPTATAAPEVVRTTPIDGEILQRTPTALGLGFDERLDQEASEFRLLTTDGQEVQGTTVVFGTDGRSVTISLPAIFPDGVYTITWLAVSAEDGSSSNGWSSFSVGNPEDANIITIPTDQSGQGHTSTWYTIGARWLTLLGLAAMTALWPIWKGVIRPVLGVHRADARPVTLRMQQLAWVALGITIGGSLLDLLARSWGEDTLDSLFATLGHTDAGFWWIVQMALLVLLGIGLAISPWWYSHRARIANSALWVLSLALPLPMVLSGHAVADDVGRVTTVTLAYLFLLAALTLAGGALWIALALRVSTTIASDINHRFRWLLIAAMLTLAFAGGLLTDDFIGNMDALTQTTFGGFAIAAVIVGVVLIPLAMFARRSAAALAVTTAVLLLTIAGLQTAPTARDQLVDESVQVREHLSFDGRDGVLLIAPGRTGVNHIRLETPGTYLQTETNIFLDLSSPDHPELGSKSVQMYRVQGNAFEHHGTEFSIDGIWRITVRIEEPGFAASIATFEQEFGPQATNAALPAAPWKFTTVSGLAGIGLAFVGVLGIATAATARGPLRKEAGGLAAIAIGLAVVVILQGRIDPILAVETGEGAINPSDMVMVKRGEDLYANYCASCHGANLRGDGPLAAALNPPPASFDAPHTKVHSNADLIYWIQYGMQGTAMPGFRSQLEDQGIRDVIAYIQWWQQNPEARTDETSPALAACEVTPLGFNEVPEVFHHGIHPETRRGTPLVRAADADVSPEQTNEVMWTIEQLVNCANQGEFRSQVRLFTPSMLQEIFPQGASYEFTSRATSPAIPVDVENAIVIEDVQSMTTLADGRIAVTIIFADPTGLGVIPGANPVYQVTLVFVYQDGIWYIDEVR
ncbi:MAG: c-type cytochrome [Thermomicrobiales bacterium]|nr:c-type cytochrome [Thermomicrobiales bacterium]